MAKVWKIAPGEHAEDWDIFLANKCIGLGWLRDADYEDFGDQAEVLRALEDRRGKNARGAGRGAAGMIWSFVKEVKKSDIVVANDRYNRVVGIGVVQSDYLPPTSPENPMLGDSTTHRHHVRKVEWVITKPADIEGARFFVQSTLWPLGAGKVGRIRRAYLARYPHDLEIRAALELLFGMCEEGGPDDGVREALAEVERQLEEEDAFDPATVEDARERTLSSIVRRRGQSSFRARLLEANSWRCAVTGCAVEAVLEAAHITPYMGEGTNHVGNGLLLRSDWHTLFDLHLMTVDAATMSVLVSPEFAGSEFHEFHGKQLYVPEDPVSRPSREALKQHQEESGLRR